MAGFRRTLGRVSDERFIVVLRDPELPPFMAVARALAHARGTPALDQTMAAKSAWGIVAEKLTAPEAQTLQQRLAGEGLACAVLPEAQLPMLAPSTPLLRWEPFDLARLRVVGAAAVPFTTTHTTKVKEGPGAGLKVVNAAIMMSTGLPIHLGGKERIVEKTTTQTDRLFYMDLLLDNPVAHYRIASHDFDYAHLKEKKSFQSFANYRQMILDLAAASPQAMLNHGVRVLRANRPIAEMLYASLAEYERELRWRLQL